MMDECPMGYLSESQPPGGCLVAPLLVLHHGGQVLEGLVTVAAVVRPLRHRPVGGRGAGVLEHGAGHQPARSLLVKIVISH